MLALADLQAFDSLETKLVAKPWEILPSQYSSIQLARQKEVKMKPRAIGDARLVDWYQYCGVELCPLRYELENCIIYSKRRTEEVVQKGKQQIYLNDHLRSFNLGER